MRSKWYWRVAFFCEGSVTFFSGAGHYGMLPWAVEEHETHLQVNYGASMDLIRCRGKLSFDTDKIKGQLSI